MPKLKHLIEELQKIDVDPNEVRIRFHPIGIPGFASAVEGAPGDIHEFTPPPDAADEGPPPGDDFPFLRG